VSGPRETTVARPGQTFELPVRCRHCEQTFHVRVNLDTHDCSEPITGFRSEDDARARALELGE
jgi:hypothetical protein